MVAGSAGSSWPEAYVRRMVVNEIIGSRRHGWRRRERPHELVEPPGASPSPETGVVERDAVWAAVRALPVRQRAVIVLRYYEDLSEQEIADALGCSRGTVKSQASAALASLRRSGGRGPVAERRDHGGEPMTDLLPDVLHERLDAVDVPRRRPRCRRP